MAGSEAFESSRGALSIGAIISPVVNEIDRQNFIGNHAVTNHFPAGKKKKGSFFEVQTGFKRCRRDNFNVYSHRVIHSK